MAKAWLNDIGLSQYSQAFQNHLVDGRMLNSLMKRDLEKHLNVSKKFHQVSILLGIELLYQVNFSREVRTKGGRARGRPLPQPISTSSFYLTSFCLPSTHLLIQPSTHLFNHPLIYPVIRPSILLPTHLPIYPFPHPPLHLSADPLLTHTSIQQ